MEGFHMSKTFLSLSKQILRTFTAALVVALAAGCGNREAAHVSEKNVHTFTKENFQTEVMTSSQPVLVDFWASWCGPCKMIAPSVAAIATEFEGKAKVGKVDVDAQTELAKEYNITAIPALLIFKDGKVVEQIIGLQEKAEIKAKLAKFVNSEPAPIQAK